MSGREWRRAHYSVALHRWTQIWPGQRRFPSRTAREYARREVGRRDGRYCAHCGAEGANLKLHLDHITPWSQGGSSHPGNLELLCEGCNAAKADT